MSAWRRSLLLAIAALSLPCCQKGALDAIELDPASLSNDLLAYYSFDEGMGTTLVDHSGNGHDGQLQGGQWLEDGAFAGALRLAGTADDHADVDEFPAAPENFSVSVWVRATVPTADEGEAILSTEVTFQGGWELHLNRHVASLGVHVGYWDTVSKAYVYWECTCLSYNGWNHVVFVRDAVHGTLSAYVGGVLQGSVPAPNPISPGETQLHIGHWKNTGRYLDADLDEVAIYGRALAPAEVAELQTVPPVP